MPAQYYLNFRPAAGTTVTCLKSFSNVKPRSTSYQPSDIRRIQSYLKPGTEKRNIRTNTMKLQMTWIFFYADCPLAIISGSAWLCNAFDFCCSLYKEFKVNDVTRRSARRPTDWTQERLLKPGLCRKSFLHRGMSTDVLQMQFGHAPTAGISKSASCQRPHR
jgi:hypothetical protein